MLEEILNLINRLKKMYSNNTFALLDKWNLPCEYDKADIEASKVKALSEAECIIRKCVNSSKGDWIKIRERLLEDGETVLCTDGENVYLVEYKADLDAGFGDIDGIIAWQLPPEPYRPKKGADE